MSSLFCARRIALALLLATLAGASLSLAAAPAEQINPLAVQGPVALEFAVKAMVAVPAFDAQPVDRDQPQDRAAVHALARVQQAVGDDAVDRAANLPQFELTQREVGLAPRDLVGLARLVQPVIGDLEFGRRGLELEARAVLEASQFVHPPQPGPREVARGGERSHLRLRRGAGAGRVQRRPLDLGLQRSDHLAAAHHRAAVDPDRFEHPRGGRGDFGGGRRLDHAPERGSRRRGRGRRRAGRGRGNRAADGQHAQQHQRATHPGDRSGAPG